MSDSLPIEYRILQAVEERVRRIRIADGYSSDIGSHVRIGGVIDPRTAPPCAVVGIDGDVSVADGDPSSKPRREMTVVVEGIGTAEKDPLIAGLRIAADIERAVMEPERYAFGGESRHLGGLARISVDATRFTSGDQAGVARAGASVDFLVSFAKTLEAPK